MSIDGSSGRGGSVIVFSDISASWGLVGCVALVDGDGDFGEIGSGFRFTLGDST